MLLMSYTYQENDEANKIITIINNELYISLLNVEVKNIYISKYDNKFEL